MPPPSDKPIYQALALPNEALANGGMEILRAGIIDGELYVNARHAFKDAAQWGEVLADITRRLGLLYAAETDLSEKEAITEIEEAYMADMGATVVGAAKPAKRKPSVRPKRKSPARATKRTAAAKRTPKRRKR